ncbi:MAG: CBS domain-containing protein [Pyrodictiaceae archaeon]
MGYRLTHSQREVLEALVKLYEKHHRMIKSKEIANMINKDEGTVRNIILSLKSLNLVDSKTGPSGGYMPTLKAYEFLRGTLTHVAVRLKRGGKDLGIIVTSIELLDIFNPIGSRAILRVYGDLSKININDVVTIGPTPFSRIIIEGEVVFIDATSNQISINVKRLVSIPRVEVGRIATRSLVTISPDASITEAAALLTSRKIKGLPVVNENGHLVGIITQSDIVRALSEGRVDAKVSEYMSSPVVTIREDEDLLRAMDLLSSRMVGRLVVIDNNGRPVGIITRTDILKYIAGLT